MPELSDAEPAASPAWTPALPGNKFVSSRPAGRIGGSGRIYPPFPPLEPHRQFAKKGICVPKILPIRSAAFLRQNLAAARKGEAPRKSGSAKRYVDLVLEKPLAHGALAQSLCQALGPVAQASSLPWGFPLARTKIHGLKFVYERPFHRDRTSLYSHG